MADAQLSSTTFTQVQGKAKSKKTRRLSEVDVTEMKRLNRKEQFELVNELLAKKVLQLKKKRIQDKAKHPKRQRREPSDLQKKQHDIFRQKVAAAKLVYKARGKTGTEAWGEAMKDVSENWNKIKEHGLFTIFPDAAKVDTNGVPDPAVAEVMNFINESLAKGIPKDKSPASTPEDMSTD